MKFLKHILYYFIFLLLNIGCLNTEGEYYQNHFSKYSSRKYILSENDNEKIIFENANWQKLSKSDYDTINAQIFQEKNTKTLFIKYDFEIDNIDEITEALLQVAFNIDFVAYLNNIEVVRVSQAEIRNNLSPKENLENEIGVYKWDKRQNFFINKSTLKKYCIEGKNTIILKVKNKKQTPIRFHHIWFYTKISNNNKYHFNFQPDYLPEEYFTESTLPVIKINTNSSVIPDEPKIIADMQIENNYKGKIAIEIRGGTSQDFAQKSYSFRTIDENKKRKNVSLLNLPEENDWILYGPYVDKTLIRNNLVYQLGQEMGLLAPKTKFCELVINNDYRGIYVLMQKIKISKEMVNLIKLSKADTIDEDITGGYLIKIDKGHEEAWASPFPEEKELHNKYFFRYTYPKGKNLNHKQKSYIKNYIIDFEAALYNNEYEKVEQLIDIHSFIDFFIINELSKNIDAYRLSTYLHKDNNNKLKMGPLWDFNFSLGLPNYNNGNTTDGWIYNSSIYIPFWWTKFMENNSFRKLLAERWKFHREKSLSLKNIYSIIDNEVLQIETPYKLHSIKWNIEKDIWPNQFNGNNLQDDVDYMKNWIKERINWLDENIEK